MPRARLSRKESSRVEALRCYGRQSLWRNLSLEGDEQFGVNIVRRACEEPVRQIVANCGTEGAVVVEKIKTDKDPQLWFHAATERYEDLVKTGVIDPTKVTRTALQNAASISSLMLTTEVMICGVVEVD